MSNKQFTITEKAEDLLNLVPKRMRSKFVSDAIINMFKKKDILANYTVKTRNPSIRTNSQSEEEIIDKPETLDNSSSTTENKPKKKGNVVVDDSF